MKTEIKIDQAKSRSRSSQTIIRTLAATVVVIAAALGIALIVATLSRKGPPLGTVTINGQTFRVEIADTDAKQRTGLMFRKELPEKTGMLFIFDRVVNVPFWMRNTYVPLDIIFIGDDRKIINIVPMPPLTDDLAKPERPYRYVLELIRGSAGQYNLRPGQLADIELPSR